MCDIFLPEFVGVLEKLCLKCDFFIANLLKNNTIFTSSGTLNKIALANNTVFITELCLRCEGTAEQAACYVTVPTDSCIALLLHHNDKLLGLFYDLPFSETIQTT